MGFYGKRWGSKADQNSKEATRSTRVTRSTSGLTGTSMRVTRSSSGLNPPRTSTKLTTGTSARVTKSYSGLNQRGNSTKLTRSSSGLNQPGTSTRLTRSSSALQRLKQLEENHLSNKSEDNFSVNDEEDHSISEPPADNNNSDTSLEKPVTSSIIDDNNDDDDDFLEHPIRSISKSFRKLFPIVDDEDDDVCFKDPPKESAVSKDNDSTAQSVDHDKNDTDTSFKTPFSMQKSSSLRMDEDFDIDTFLGETNEESTTTMGESGIGPEISDDDFLNQFPKVDLSMINKIENPKAQKKNQSLNNNPKRAKQRSIAEYAISTSSPRIENNTVTPNTSKGNTGSFPSKRCVNNIAVENCSIAEYAVKTSSPLLEKKVDIPSTSKGFKELNGISVKRNLNDILDFDNDIENQNPKKPKLDVSLKMEDLPIGARSPLKDKNINTDDDDTDTDDTDDTDNEEFPSNDLSLNDYAFPNMADNIDFDVSAIPSNLRSTFRGVVGKKRYQTFLKERFLTNECVEKLYNSLLNMPKDAIERDPRGLTVQLMPHQRHALTWMRWRENQQPKGGIIADDMGLGKTIQMISLILAAKIDKKDKARANGETVIDTDDEDLDEYWGEAEDDECRKIVNGRTLVVCPASVLGQWEKEIHTRCRRGMLRVFVYHGPCRKISTKELAKYDVVVTTYHIIQQERDLHIAPSTKKTSKLFKIKWERVILDEAHYIRNYQGKISISACEIPAKIKWALTGTPIQNRKSDFYALLKFLRCHPYDEKAVWQRWIGSDTDAANKRLKVITSSLMLRRTKAELIAKGAIQTLPQKRFDVIEIDLDPEEKIVYQKLLLHSRTFFNEFLEQREDREHKKRFGTQRRRTIVQQEVPDKITRVLLMLMKNHIELDTYYILVLILRLRQMCCHPSLVKSMVPKEDADLEALENSVRNQKINEKILAELDKIMIDDEDEFDIDDETARRVLSNSNHVFDTNRRGSKVRAVMDVIHNILEKGEKVIVVSQWTSFLKVIANNLYYMQDANYEMFSGKVAVKNRQGIVDRLNDPDDSLNVLLLSLTAGGVGLNLVGANNLLLLDLHWNPQLETQAMDRIYRFGQENNVHIYKFICRDTIEQNVKKLQDKKLKIAENVLSGTVSNRLTIEDLKTLFS